MGWNDHLDDSELENLPPEAFGNKFDVDGPFDPDDVWLEVADEHLKTVAMREWFLARFCDPADETPYNGREGGYLFLHGGPFDPSDELTERFSGIVDDELVQEVIDEMHQRVGNEWAPVRADDDDYFDDRFDLELPDRGDPLRKLKQRLDQTQLILKLDGDPMAKYLAMKLVFGAAISALESFLWETAHYWIENDEKVLRDVITKLPVFRDDKIKLGDIFERYDGLKIHVKTYLQNLVWHRWEKVTPLFRDGLGVALPSTKVFENALVKRHDIVHRSGHDKEGVAIHVTTTEIDDLCTRIVEFAVEVDARLAAGKAT